MMLSLIMAVSKSYFLAVIVICIERNTTVPARSFEIGSLQLMLLPYMEMLLLQHLLNVAMRET